jgi:hypothetical protein
MRKVSSSPFLTEKEKTGANPEKASIHNKRIVIMKEPDASEPLRNDRVKDMTGGGNISCFLITRLLT